MGESVFQITSCGEMRSGIENLQTRYDISSSGCCACVNRMKICSG